MATTKDMSEGQRAYEAKRAAKAGMSLDKWLTLKEREKQEEQKAREKAAEPPKPVKPPAPAGSNRKDATELRKEFNQLPDVKMFGETVSVNAEVVTLGGFSAHADQTALLAWVAAFGPPPRKIWLVHGEPRGSDALAAALAQRGLNVAVARTGEVVELAGE